MTRIVILGAGGTAREIAEILILQQRDGAEVEVVGFLDDDRAARGLPAYGLAVVGCLDDARRFPDSQFVIGIASYRNPGLRARIVAGLALPPERYHTVIDTSARVAASATLGPGCVLMPNVTIAAGAHLESHVLVAQACCVNHDVRVGAGTVLAPSVTVAGGAQVGRNAYVGAGARLAPGINVGDEALVGIGSVVIAGVPARATVFGNPARVINSGTTVRWSPPGGRVGMMNDASVERAVQRIVVEILETSPSRAMTDSAGPVAWDSLQKLNVAVALEQTFDITLTPEDLAAMTSVKSLVALVERNRSGIRIGRDPSFRHHHVGVAVQHLSEGLAWYCGALGLTLVGGPVDDLRQQVTVALLKEETNSALVELVAPLSPESPVSRYASAGSAAYHLCYEVPDVTDAVRWLIAKKCVLVSGPFPAPAFENRPLAWMYSPTRHLIELLQQHA